jgi:hypothetical protein
MLLPSDATSFLTLMADTLRLTPETLSMAYVYIHRYRRWISEDASASSLLDDHVCPLPPTFIPT